MFSKILVPIDGSEYAEKALDFTLELAEKCRSSIEIFIAVSIDYIPILQPSAVTIKAVAPSYFESLLKEVQVHHEKVLLEALKKAKRIKPNLNISSKLLEGRPSDKIIEEAKEGNFDLIVIGSRGLSGVKEVFLGSVADRVADRAPCPVLIIR